MQKIVIIFFVFIFALNIHSQQADITIATRLISEKKTDEAYPILNKIIIDKNQTASAKLQAIKLLATYPLGTLAYATRHVFAMQLFSDQMFFSSLSLDDQIFILRTGALGAFQASEWIISRTLFEKIIKISQELPNIFKAQSAHHDDLGISIEYLGWILLNQNRQNEVIKYWFKSIKDTELNTVWREAIIRDLGQVIGEILFSTTSDDFSNCRTEIEIFLKTLSLSEKNKFKTGLKTGIERSNYEDSKYKNIIERVKGTTGLLEINQDLILEDSSFASTRPCYYFEITQNVKENNSSVHKTLATKVKACWQEKSSTQVIANDSVNRRLYMVAENLGLGLINAEINEKNGEFNLACLQSIKLGELEMAIRNCNQDVVFANKEAMLQLLSAQQDQSNWIALWDIIFSKVPDEKIKIDWIKKYYPTPLSTLSLYNVKGEGRPLIWWFEETMNKISRNEPLEVLWCEEFENSHSQVWKILKMSSEQKHQAILSISISTKNYGPIIDNINEIEASLRPKSNLEKTYTVWLNQYITTNRQVLLNSQLKNSPYYDLWISSLVFISKIKTQDLSQITAWNKKNKRHCELYPSTIPDIAIHFSEAEIIFSKSNQVRLNLKNSYFANNLSKCIKLLKKSLVHLQAIALADPNFAQEAEDLKKDFLKRMVVKIQNIEAPTDWNTKDQDLWKTEKDKIILAIGGEA
jgi:hypothetical protein